MDIQLQPFIPHGSVCPCMLQRAKPCSILFGYSKSRVYFLVSEAASCGSVFSESGAPAFGS